MIRVGIVGVGFMGWIHWLAYQKVAGVRVAAISTRNAQRRAGDWRGIQGNFGPPGEQVDLAGVAAHADLDELLADPQIDLVDITLPTSLHADVAIRALAAGKHVLCEKPMALRLADCRRMVAAAKKANRLLMIGHVLPFFPEYDWALKTIRGGEYGGLRGGAFRRVIANPTWLESFWSPEQIGGPMLDLHVHDAHFIRLVFGMPNEVVTAGRSRNGLPEFWHSQFRFAEKDLVVEATSGTIDQQGRAFTHGYEIHLERATLAFDFAVIGGDGKYLCEPMLLNNDGGVQRPELPGGDAIDAFTSELREVVRSIRDGQTSEILGALLAQDAMRICERQAVSLERGRLVKM
ncbi:MAG: Gfo/Idh/MocA family oxidoreductase [Pirellulales bacterium]